MKKFLLSGLAALLAMGLMGSSFAYFSDIETSTGNTFTAGTWDIEVNGHSLPFRVANILPGWSGTQDAVVHNLGTESGQVYITADNFLDPSTYWGPGYAEPLEPEPSIGVTPEEFAKILRMKIYASEDTLYQEDEVIYDGPAHGLATDPFPIGGGQYRYLWFVAYLPGDLYQETNGVEIIDVDDNLYQADGVAFDIVFHGTTEITIGP